MSEITIASGPVDAASLALKPTRHAGRVSKYAELVKAAGALSPGQALRVAFVIPEGKKLATVTNGMRAAIKRAGVAGKFSIRETSEPGQLAVIRK